MCIRDSFLGAQTLTFGGDSVLDAGTEVNTEMDAAFINQTGPNTGETEGGVVSAHPGFNGSIGNPGGDQIILGGTNAFGDLIDPDAADFTAPGAMVATVHVNTVARQAGDAGNNFLWGGRADDFIDGGAGNDFIVGGSGWDVLNGDAGRDIIYGGSGDDLIDGGSGRDFLIGGSGFDDINGGSGNDYVSGGSGNDNLFGGSGRDYIVGGSGNDVIGGGTENDALVGGHGNDVFVFAKGDGKDTIYDFDRLGDDRLALNVDGFNTFEDVLDVAHDVYGVVKLDFGAGDALVLYGVDVADLSADDFLFG